MKSLREQLSEILPLVSKNTADSTTVPQIHHTNVDKPNEKFTNCPKCGCKLKKSRYEQHLEKHRNDNSSVAEQSHSDTNQSNDQALLQCPLCNVTLKRSSVLKHLRKVHQTADHILQQIAAAESLSASPIINAPVNKRHLNKKERDKTRIWQPKRRAEPSENTGPRTYPVGTVVAELKKHMQIDNPKHGDRTIKKAFLMAAGKYAVEGNAEAFDEIARLIPRGVWHNRLADFKSYVLSMPPDKAKAEFEHIRRTLDKMNSVVGYQANSTLAKWKLPSRQLPTSELHRKLMRALQFSKDTGFYTLFTIILEDNNYNSKKVLAWIKKYTPYEITVENGKYKFFKEPFREFDIARARRDVIYGKNENRNNKA